MRQGERERRWKSVRKGENGMAVSRDKCEQVAMELPELCNVIRAEGALRSLAFNWEVRGGKRSVRITTGPRPRLNILIISCISRNVSNIQRDGNQEDDYRECHWYSVVGKKRNLVVYFCLIWSYMCVLCLLRWVWMAVDRPSSSQGISFVCFF